MSRRKALKVGGWYRVWWDDALAACDGWQEEKDAVKNGVASIVTVGKVIHKDARQVILAQSASEHAEKDKEVMNTQAIPARWITKVEPLP